MSDCSSSASLKWRGKERGEALHVLTAQVRKFTVNIFMSELICSQDIEVQCCAVVLCCVEDDL